MTLVRWLQPASGILRWRLKNAIPKEAWLRADQHVLQHDTPKQLNHSEPSSLRTADVLVLLAEHRMPTSAVMMLQCTSFLCANINSS